MLAGESTFTMVEITTLLTGEGLEKGSEPFQDAVRQRFLPTDATNEKGETLYIEN